MGGIKPVKSLPVSLSSNSQYLCVEIIGSSEIGSQDFISENIYSSLLLILEITGNNHPFFFQITNLIHNSYIL